MPNTNDLCSMAGWLCVCVCVCGFNASAVKSIREKVVAANNHTNSSEDNETNKIFTKCFIYRAEGDSFTTYYLIFVCR